MGRFFLLYIPHKNPVNINHVKFQPWSSLRKKCPYSELLNAEIWTRITPNKGTFYAVHIFQTMVSFILFQAKRIFFLLNLVQKVKIICLCWNSVPRLLMRCAKFDSDVHFFCFRLEIPFLGKFCPKYQNFLIKHKIWY